METMLILYEKRNMCFFFIINQIKVKGQKKVKRIPLKI